MTCHLCCVLGSCINTISPLSPVNRIYSLIRVSVVLLLHLWLRLKRRGSLLRYHHHSTAIVILLWIIPARNVFHTLVNLVKTTQRNIIVMYHCKLKVDKLDLVELNLPSHCPCSPKRLISIRVGTVVWQNPGWRSCIVWSGPWVHVFLVSLR